ncbi:amino acid ABC transporter ATP-binding/permease protein [Novosphingobium sp. BW1]|uniref:amino acid ABC transporter ATP-binding/permease protein n=1 Tax=Novosphingobium sp. BW1 TaxID=2592621 RepID=UPI001F074A24|nr:ATP-binding cassette domain-containing protein [Novosphingobium sp. BW1]
MSRAAFSHPFELAKPTPPVRHVLRLGTLSAIVAALSGLLLLGISGWFLTGAAIAGASGLLAVQTFNYLIPSAAIRLLAILRTVSRYGERMLSHKAALTAMADLRSRLFRLLAAQDTRYAPDVSAGEASARLIGDIESLEDLIVRQPTRPGSLAAALAGVALAALSGWLSALLLAGLLVIFPFAVTALSRRLTAAPAHDAAEALGELRARYVDMAQARAEIAAYGLVDTVLDELAEPITRLDAARWTLFRAEAGVAAFQLFYGALAAIAVLATASGGPALAALGLLAATAAIEALAAISRTALRQARVEEGLRRLESLLDLAEQPLPAAPSERFLAAPLRLGTHAIAPGSHIALLGASGSGKTLALEALAGLRASTAPIWVDDAPLAECAEDTLRGQFALSAQDAPLLAGSIADNLRLARPGITEDAMRAALATACLDERIARLPAGLDTLLGEDGAPLSGGERKRLSLARALLAGRPWLLLDEPTEGLDGATERELVRRLGGWLESTDTGLVLVSHRPHPLSLAQHSLPIEALPRT